MKHFEQGAKLRIHHVPAEKSASPFLSQKTMDAVVMIVSCAGLVSAIAFLLTMH